MLSGTDKETLKQLSAIDAYHAYKAAVQANKPHEVVLALLRAWLSSEA